MPTTSPRVLNSGPPELPGLTATSVWMKGTTLSSGSERPLALTTPAVTVFSKPNGEPIASTHSPTFRSLVLPSVTTGRFFASILQHRDVGLRVGAEHLGAELAPVGQLDGDFLGVAHHVRVGQDDAVGADDEARALAARRHRRHAAAAWHAGPCWPWKRRKNSRTGRPDRCRHAASASCRRSRAGLAGHADVDHGRAVALR